MNKAIFKRFLIAVMSVVCVLSFCSCGSDKPDDANANEPNVSIDDPVSQGANVPGIPDVTAKESMPEVTSPAVTDPENTVQTPEVTTPPTSDTEKQTESASTAAEDTKATDATTKKTEKTTKKTEKTEESTKKTEKTESTTKVTESPVQGVEIDEDINGEEDIDLGWEDVNIDEFLASIGADDIDDLEIND